MVDSPIPTVRLKKGHERRILAGHLWVFSNEIASDFKTIPPGSLVSVGSGRDRFLGIGYANPHSLIAIRLLTREKEPIDEAFFRRRIKNAHDRRLRLYPDRSAYRLCHSEGDFLPGLIVDKYGDFLAVQILTAGMEHFGDLIVDLLWEAFRPKGIILRNDTRYRGLEGLSTEKAAVVRGDVPCEISVEICGLTYGISLLEGQKTGFYLDQVENRLALAGLTQDKTILDAFCYGGAWGLSALSFGGREATFVDSSGPALSMAKEAAAANNLASRCHYCESDVFDYLKNSSESFDIVVLDPPAFVKTKTKIKEAVAGYTDLNRRAMERTTPGGILVTCSCSHHVPFDLFQEIIQQAGRMAGRTLRLLERRSQARDHPVLLSVPETEYLKCFFLEVL